MAHFIKGILLFFTPFQIWIFIVCIIDPYNYFPFSSQIVNEKLKLNIAYKLNYPLFKLIRFKHYSTQYILLGDSRTNSLDIGLINSYSGHDFTNLAYGGGTIPEIINTFWLINKKNELKEVYIGLNFNLYNKYNYMNRVSEAIALMDDFFAYACSNYTVESTYLIVKNMLWDVETNIGVPNTSKEQFWLYQLNVTSKAHYKQYQYPKKYFEELKLISNYCHENKIKLVFFIPPTHYDLQLKVQEFNLQKYETIFKNDLIQLGDLYDFNYPSDLTKNKDNFDDPYHFSSPIAKMIIKDLFTNETKSNVTFLKCISNKPPIK